MKILKFGGTSVGSAERIKHVANLITTAEKKIVVLSAVSGTTNALVTLSELAYKKEEKPFQLKVKKLRQEYSNLASELFGENEYLQKASAYLDNYFSLLRTVNFETFSSKDEKIILAQGELISTRLMHLYLHSKGFDAILLPALAFMKTVDGEPDTTQITKELTSILQQHTSVSLFITQGYICMNELNEIDNLRRGGSDYSASIIGAATQATEIQIWTDIDGMHNNDPRIVDKTFPVHELSFEEAAELAYFGAKILHPASVLPAQKNNIPVRLLNTMQPKKEGTLIRADVTHEKKITAIAAKDGIVVIKIRSSRMLLAYGFLRKVFEVFEKYKTPIDMITTSEVAISLTIDDTTFLNDILRELDNFGIVEYNENQTIICVVGRFLQEDAKVAAKVIQVLDEIPIRMISYGGSKYNISVLIQNTYKKQALQLLNKGLFFENAT